MAESFGIIGAFSTGDTERAPIHCQKPTTGGRCYNPDGPENPPNGVLHNFTDERTKSTIPVCDFCAEYLRKKWRIEDPVRTGSIGRSARLALPPVDFSHVATTVDIQAIRAGTNKAQRGSIHSPPVVAVGYQTPATARYNEGSSSLLRGAPFVGIPALPPPPTLPSNKGRPGIGSPSKHTMGARKRQPSNLLYESETYKLAYSTECQRAGKKRSAVIFSQDIQNSALPKVSAALTGPELRELVREDLMRAWNSATFYYPLTNEMWCLKDEHGVDLVQHFPNAPALRAACLKSGPSGQPLFRHGHLVKVIVMLTAEAYETVKDHIDECRAQATDSQEPHIEDPPCMPNDDKPAPQASRSTQSTVQLSASLVRQPPFAKPRSASNAVLSAPQLPTVPATPHSTRLSSASVRLADPSLAGVEAPMRAISLKRVLPTSPTSSILLPASKRACSSSASRPLGSETLPSVSSELERALVTHGRQGTMTADGARSQENLFYPIPFFSLQQLSSMPDPFNINDALNAHDAVLIYDVGRRDHFLGSGTFKKCQLGRLNFRGLDQPTTGLGSCPTHKIVAIKRPYTVCTATNRTQQLSPQDELQFIKREGVVLQYCNALLGEVNSWIKSATSTGLQRLLEPPPVPQIRFVQAGIAKFVDKKTTSSRGYLVEERIPEAQGFTRFIGNGSAIPAEFPAGSRRALLAEYCSFCQHVQWIVTNGKAYCADWQGGVADSEEEESLLTDPQLMTNPTLGKLLFADGNVPAAFYRFTSEHSCLGNRFCEFYKPPALEPSCDTSCDTAEV
ncbi:hypothetical protein FRC12_024224 [Ceratobasidium sp. 428]|nr:hypothetical protein FRC12_024224 [Ceratobasidium sp. 428]